MNLSDERPTRAYLDWTPEGARRTYLGQKRGQRPDDTRFPDYVDRPRDYRSQHMMGDDRLSIIPVKDVLRGFDPNLLSSRDRYMMEQANPALLRGRRVPEGGRDADPAENNPLRSFTDKLYRYLIQLGK